MPNIRPVDAKDRAEQARTVVENSSFEFSGMKLKLKISVGMTTVQEDDDPATLVHRADAALYASKQAGRNCSHYHDGSRCEHFGAALTSMPVENADEPQAEANAVDAYTDKTTSLPSRKVFNEELRRRVSEARRYGTKLSLMVVLIDEYSTIHQRGKQAADMVMSVAAEFTRARLRDTDLVAYYDEGQLAALLPCTSVVEASIPAERLRVHVANYRQLKFQGEPLVFTLSMGLAELLSNEDAASLLGRAQQAALSDPMGNRTLVHKEYECHPVISSEIV